MDILEEAWRRVKTNGGAAGVDKVSIEEVRDYCEARFLRELQQELHDQTYRVSHVRRVHIPKPGQPGRSRPLGIPTVRDRVAQMAVKLVIEPLQAQFDKLRLVVNQEKSKLTELDDGFAFLGFEFRRRGGRVYMWPRMKSRKNILQRVRQKVRTFRSSERLDVVIKSLNPVLWGWCTYFRVGHSNRVFHIVDWAIRREFQLWLRRKHRCSWRHAQKRWHYRFLHDQCALYRMVGKVSHLEGP